MNKDAKKLGDDKPAKVKMKFEDLNASQRESSLLKDWRRDLSDRQLLELCLEAVQGLKLTAKEIDRLRLNEFSPQMLLTLLTYSYACGIYGSEDIEWAQKHHETIRYICARTYPEAKTIRLFRKLNRDYIDRCLQHVIEQAWRKVLDSVQKDYAFHSRLEHWLENLARRTAREKTELAIIADTAAFDW